MARGDGIDTCKFCGSDELWGNYFDADGYGVTNSIESPSTDPGVKWDLICGRCGKFQLRRNTTRNAGGRDKHLDG